MHKNLRKVIWRQTATNPNDQLNPKFLLFGQKLSEALEEFAMLHHMISILARLLMRMLLLSRRTIHDAVKGSNALLVIGDKDIGSLHPQLCLCILRFGGIWVNQE